MRLQALSLLPLVLQPAGASWSKNLNYRSPSEHHPSLGISIHRVVKRNDPSSSYDPKTLNFTHGVASGDPYPESVILWTRAAPQSDNSNSNLTVSGYAPLFDHDNEKYVAASKSPVCIDYKVASDQALEEVVDHGRVFTSSDVDFTVKVCISSVRVVQNLTLTTLRSKQRISKPTRNTTTSSLSVVQTTRAPLDARRPHQQQMTTSQKLDLRCTLAPIIRLVSSTLTETQSAR
jgi:hypothetical protein